MDDVLDADDDNIRLLNPTPYEPPPPTRPRSSNTIGYTNSDDNEEEEEQCRFIYESIGNIPNFMNENNVKILRQQQQQQQPSVLVAIPISEWELQQEQQEIMDFVDGIVSNNNENQHHYQEQEQDLNNEQLVNIQQSALQLRRMSNEFQLRRRRRYTKLFLPL